MPLLYGSPLPPGVEAPTRGELRIRVEKLLIDNAAVNQNPLMNFHFGTQNISLDPIFSSHATSPNRFVVPVDYCAVGPLFWGEEKASVSCQPSTAKHNRGSFTLVYPVKVEESAFQKYLKNMSASSHQGLQIEVFVPSSYSGRPPVLIGKCAVPLDSLASPEVSFSSSKSTLQGWFSILHFSQQQAPVTMDGDVFSTSTTPTLTVPIGKLKLHVSLYYFSKPARAISKRRPKSDSPSSGLPAKENEVGRREDSSETKESSKSHHVTYPLPCPCHDPLLSVAGLNTSGDVKKGDDGSRNSSGMEEDSSDDSSVKVERVIPLSVGVHMDSQAADQHQKTTRTPAEPVSNSFLPAAKATSAPTEVDTPPVDTSSSTTAFLMMELLRKGAQLRNRMEMAATESMPLFPSGIGETPLPRPQGFSSPSSTAAASQIKFLDEHYNEAGGMHTLPDLLRRPKTQSGLWDYPLSGRAPKGKYRETDKSNIDDVSSVIYTSEDSDAEQFMVQLRKDQVARRKEGDMSQTSTTTLGRKQMEETPVVSYDPCVGVANDARFSLLPASDTQGGMKDKYFPALDSRKTIVEMRFTDVSFASTDMTKDLEEIRINVRLSKNITVESPASGPFSSFVHRIPLAQPTICLSFTVCSYSEKTSRLVIEFIKVKSKVRQVESTVERDVISEELLGLCIVGMFTQSRDIVLHDPVSSQNNVFCHLDLQLFSKGSARMGIELAANPTALVTLESNHAHQSKVLPSSHRFVDGSDGSSREMIKSRTQRGSPHVVKRRLPTHDTSSSTTGGEAGSGSDDDVKPSFPSNVQTTSKKAGHVDQQFAGQLDLIKMKAEPSRSQALLCLCIHDIQGLPQVSLASVDPSGNGRGLKASIAGSAQRPMSTTGDTSTDGHTAPNAFVALDTITGADGLPIDDWYVATRGILDRTEVVYNSERPFFDYRCVLCLPLRPDSSNGLVKGKAEPPSLAPASVPELPHQRAALRELKLTLWHYAGKDQKQTLDNSKDSLYDANKGEVDGHGRLILDCAHKKDVHDQVPEEVQFWSHAAQMGHCCVDLRPLKYLNYLEGYYRVVYQTESQTDNDAGLFAVGLTPQSSGIGKVEHQTEGTESIVVGYIHISVNLL